MQQAADGQPHPGSWAAARGAPSRGVLQQAMLQARCSAAAAPAAAPAAAAAAAASEAHASGPNGCAKAQPIALDARQRCRSNLQLLQRHADEVLHCLRTYMSLL